MSPWRARMSAIRSMVALNQIASPGGAGDDQFEAVFGGAAEPDEAFLRSSSGGPFGGFGVGGDDCGFEQSFQPAPRHRTQ